MKVSEWFSHGLIRLIRAFSHTTIETRTRVAGIVAPILWVAIPKRRHVTLTNLRLCFPDKTEAERVAIAKSLYRNMARAILDHGVLWYGTAEEIRAMVKVEGLDQLLSSEVRPLIAVAPHFIGLDAAGIALTTWVQGVALYQRQSNPVVDKAAYEGRMRFHQSILVEKGAQDYDLRPVLRAMKSGIPFYYLPDMDHGRLNSIFVPFFGVPAATVPMVSRMARLGRAKVIFIATEMTPEGYVVHISDVWQDFPTRDVEADTRRVTEELERWILKMPDQYMWMHRRFKTRPEGEPGVY